jgi:hypothetical protein
MLANLGDDVSPEVKRKLRQNPPLWVRNALRHPVDPSRNYDFKDENGKPLTHLLHDDSWLHPENWADINVLLLARGELKSTSTGWLATWAHDAYPQHHTYYIAPSNDQVIDYLSPIRQTYVEQAGMDARRKTNNKKEQVFKTYQEHEDGSTDPILGRFQTDSGYSEESVRGKHSQMGITDETQDLSRRVFNVFLPSIDMGLPDADWAPTVFCIGTPKETGSFYHDLWERSDKRTWNAETEEWDFQEEVDPYTLSAEEVNDLPGDISLEEDDEYTVHGWHVDWINSPLHSDADVARAKQQMGEMEFANEVLANFYDPEDNLLADKHVDACLTESYNFRETPHNSENTTIVVADWGGGSDQNASDTIFLAAEQIEYDDHTEFVVLDIDFIEQNLRNREQIQEYEKWLIQYDADVGLVDYGFGEQAMESLQHGDDTMAEDGYMDTVSAVHYGNVKNSTEIKWVTDDNNNELFFTADKSRSATRMVESVRDEEWVLPKGTSDSTGLSTETSESDGVRFKQQVTAPYKTLSDTKTGKKRVDIETPGNHRDDAFDALTFAWLAFNEVANEEESVVAFDGTARAGV